MLKTGYAQLSKLLNAIANWKHFKTSVWIACLIPALLLIIRVVASELLPFGLPSKATLVNDTIGGLGVDPLKTLLHMTGEDSLAILLASLAVTPIRRIFKVNGIQKVRRLLGVTSFFYALLHVSLYLGLDQLCYSVATCEFRSIVNDVLKRKFIMVGMVSFSILLVLAVTSTNAMIRRLKKNWQKLHRLVYIAGIAAVIHFIWIQKSDYAEPLMWAAWLAAFLLIRVYFSLQKRRATAARA